MFDPVYNVQCNASSHLDHLQAALQAVSLHQPDLFIVSQEGRQIHIQRSLLCLFSRFVSTYLQDVPCCITPTISLPLSYTSINNLLKLLKEGVATTDSVEELSAVGEAAATLGIDLGDFDFSGENQENQQTQDNQTNLDQSYNMLVKTEPGLEQSEKKKKVKSKVRVKRPVKQEIATDEADIDANEAEMLLQEAEEEGKSKEKRPKSDLKDPKEKPICNLCGKIFNDNYKFNRHMMSHTGEKPFGCDYCEKRFARKDKLKKHLIVHLGESLSQDDIKFSCDKCGKGFAAKNKLEKHVNSCGNSNQNEPTQIKFNCNLCSQQFYDKQLMIAHLKDHQKYGEEIANN